MKQKRLKYWDNDKRIIPMTKTSYVKVNGKWVVCNVEKSNISRNMSKNVLASVGLPFERSHRRTKRNRWGHNEPFDTFSSISPDGRQKSTWYVDFAQGQKNYEKLRDKHFYDRARYAKRKQNKNAK